MNVWKIDIDFWQYTPLSSGFRDNRTDIKSLPYLSVVQSKKGNYEIKIDDSPIHNTGDGGFFIAPSGCRQTITHHIPAEGGKMFARWLFIDARINGSYTLDELYSFPSVLDAKAGKELDECFNAMEAADSLFEKMSILYHIVGLLVELSEGEKTPKNDGISNVIKYMHLNYAQKITVGELAEIANMSESNLYAAFKKKYSDSPLNYINRLRLSVAKEMLVSSSEPIENVAAAVGIHDQFYFCKLFKKAFGLSPSIFRKQSL